ncbi:pyruvate kinase [Spizellomyces sp. 'palustris']|nr:pyruvate kinase [Spizellomyces sp. 'palustris']
MPPTSVSIPPCPTPSLAATGTAEATSMKKKTLQKRRTKIVGTLGPASVPKIKELILAGINMFRLNFSHIENPETQTPVIEEIRKHSDDLNIPVAILGDLCGPKIRCNDFKPGPTIQLTPGRPVRLIVSSGPGTDGVITTKIPEVVRQLENGHRILLDDGNLTLRVSRRISDTELECEVLVGGELKSHKGINVPDIRLGVAALTDKDKRDAEYAYRMRLEYVAMSFVQRVEDVEELKRLFGEWKNSDAQLSANTRGIVRHPVHDDIDAEVDELEENWRPHIILKIEKPQALDVIDDLIRVGDGIMVARGDMGVEISLERVPVIQKMLIRKANAADKPVITATQMLETMINSPVPTRAEVSDVANAVFDGTDAVMLSAECATGKYPIETVQMMARVCQQAEDGDTYMHPQVITAHDRRNRVNDGSGEFAYPIADATVAAAEEANASAIIVFTTLGSMAIYVAKRRPNRPIIAVTSSYSLYRRLVLNYGVYPTLTPVLKIRSVLSKGPVSTKILPPETDTSPTKTSPTGQSPTKSAGTLLLVSNTDQIYAQAERDILKTADELGLERGDPVVFCAGFHAPWPGLSNTLRIARFGDAVRSAKARHLWGDVVSGVRAGHAASKQSLA